MKNVVAVILLAAWAGQLAAAEVYKWRDAEGHVHYSSQPPPPGAKSIERKSAKGSFIETDKVPYETSQAANKHPVTLYAFDGCGEPCASAAALLEERGIPYSLRNREEDKGAVVKLTGDNQVPVLVVGNQPPLTGFSAGKWNQQLDLAGYPKRNPLARSQPKRPAVPAASETKDSTTKEGIEPAKEVGTEPAKPESGKAP